MEERFRFIEAVAAEEFSVADLCRQFGVSRKTGCKWLERYRQGGLEALRDRSRAPEHHPNEVLEDVENAILQLRREHMHWGPAKLRAWLREREPKVLWPAASTMGEMVKRAGLTHARKLRRRATPSREPLAHATESNRVWCADFKGWFWCGDGSRCDPFTMTDAFSRYLLRCQIVPRTGEEQVRPIMEAAMREYGVPDAIRTDNGEPFASCGIGGLSQLSVWWIRLGIRPERIKPGKPQQNGRHERMHLTLKQETAQPPAANLRDQQRRFDVFRSEFNEQRPHEALEMKPPASLYQPTTRSYPSRLEEPIYPRHYVERRVGPCGTLRWGNHKFFVGKALVHQTLGLEQIGDGTWRIWFSFCPLGTLTEGDTKIIPEPTAKPRRGRIGLRQQGI